ncbi:uncharacterized protein LOC117929038 [Vitis riparia]|uniref:uncharacterized protein LOC117929038 n=1 Tax=Vitis riparia TaxID=96939 RepID=UPI00155A8842|nr:uncharacterized protein LOC117929038 [Vitis riparia]
MAATEEPIICKLDRLDNILRQLEEIRGCSRSSKSSCTSTPSSGALTSDGQTSSVDLSPKSLEKHHCRPIADVRTETEVKGSLMERLVQVEVRLLKLCLQVEEELEEEKRREEKARSKAHKKGLKQFVKSCVKGGIESPKAHSQAQ